MANINELIAYAQDKYFVEMFFVEHMSMGCILLTDSGGNKRYVAGLLDSGVAFAERCPNKF